MNWHPISTAPKDATYILLYRDRYDEPEVTAAFWSIDSADWFNSEASSNPVWFIPTHWTPLVLPVG